ncbi:MAG TPA: signal peptidase I [Candidatus Magasanikbacteria bacterium]|nr:signal peptidase I [Candidatus Magasanikbacteria bacterium]
MIPNTVEEQTEEQEKIESLPEKEEVVSEVEKGFLAKTSLFFLELIKIVILAAITIGLVRYFLFKPFYVKGQSMEPNFYESDYLIIDELSYRFREPERGEVVVFRAPVDKKEFYLKRILGLPGERVKVGEGKVVVYNDNYPQGILVEENYLTETTPGSTITTLGSDQYFVMGDNRDASYDSRRFGPIEKTDFVGRAWVRGWPFSRLSAFEVPKYNF